METLERLQELAQSADLMVLESNDIVRLIWDEDQGGNESERINLLRQELSDLIDAAQSAREDDGQLHIEISTELVDVERLQSWTDLI